MAEKSATPSPHTPRFPLGAFLCPDPVSTRPAIPEPALPLFRSVAPPSLLPFRTPYPFNLATTHTLGHAMSDPVTSAGARGQVWAIGHAVSYPLMPGHSPHRPIPHTEFGIRKPGIRNPRAPSMERYRTFFPSHTFSSLTLEHGAVGFHPT